MFRELFPYFVTFLEVYGSNSSEIVTAPSGTAKSVDIEIRTCSESWSKILIRCVTWH